MRNLNKILKEIIYLGITISYPHTKSNIYKFNQLLGWRLEHELEEHGIKIEYELELIPI